jgi:hypothetical protein
MTEVSNLSQTTEHDLQTQVNVVKRQLQDLQDDIQRSREELQQAMMDLDETDDSVEAT